MKHLVLLGGGHAHLHALRDFAKQPLAAARVTLVSQHADLVYSGRVPAAVAGHCLPEDCRIALAPLAQRAHCTFVRAAATGIDATRREIALVGGEVVPFDVLSIDTGATVDRDTIPGAREHGLFIRPMEHFLQLLDPLLALTQERALDLVVIGAGAAGVELAMALQYRMQARARVSVVTGGTAPVPGHPRGVQRRVLRALKRCGVTVFEDACTEISASHVLLAGGARLACDAPVLAIGPSAPSFLQGSGLALDAHGFIATGPTLQSTSHPQVFAAGDVATRADAPHPKSGVYAVRAGPPLAVNLRRFVAGGELQAWQPQRRALNLLSCGDRYAIASWGEWSFEGRWVWRWKDRIDREFVERNR